MNKIDLEKLLDRFAENIKNDEEAYPNDDNSYENSSYRNNIAQIRNALAKGRIDSEIVTEDMIRGFILDGLDFIDYEESVKEYCEEKGIVYEEYKADRKQIIDQLSENLQGKSPKFKISPEEEHWASEIEIALEEEYGEEFVEEMEEQFSNRKDYLKHLITTYGDEYPKSSEEDLYEDYDPIPEIEEKLERMYGKDFVKTIRNEHPYDYTKFLDNKYQWVLFEKEQENVASGIEVQESENGAVEPELQEPEDVTVGEVEEFLKDSAQQAALPENVDIKNNWMSLMKNWIKNITNTIKNTFQR